VTQSVLEALLKQSDYYCPHCLETGHLTKLLLDSEVNLVCVAGEHGIVERELAFTWEDVQNIVTVLTISKADTEDLKKMVTMTQEARSLARKVRQQSPLMES